jgi:uncharacterized protein YqjF (DUF2071 family)
MPETPFLTAKWLDLVLATWRIPADLVRPRLAAGLEPDLLPGDDPSTAYVSLVAFRFVDTRVLGLAVPMHRDFPEVNLRVYVRTTDEDPPRRGVAFIAELVPRAMISTIANLLYHEHYRTVPLRVSVTDEAEHRRLECEIEDGDRVHRLRVRGRRPAVHAAEGDVAHFFKEHTWGFGRDESGARVVYRVDHPVWRVYEVAPGDLDLDFDFGELYGEPWQVLDGRPPDHVAFAEGSEIAVYPRAE